MKPTHRWRHWRQNWRQRPQLFRESRNDVFLLAVSKQSAQQTKEKKADPLLVCSISATIDLYIILLSRPFTPWFKYFVDGQSTLLCSIEKWPKLVLPSLSSIVLCFVDLWFSIVELVGLCKGPKQDLKEILTRSILPWLINVEGPPMDCNTG